MDNITSKLASFQQVEMTHEGVISFWERKMPDGKNWHLFFKRKFNGAGFKFGLYSFRKEADRNAAMVRMAAMWEGRRDPDGKKCNNNPFPFACETAAENLKKYSAYRDEKKVSSIVEGEVKAGRTHEKDTEKRLEELRAHFERQKKSRYYKS